MTPEEQLAQLRRGVVSIVPEDELVSRLREKRPLRVKLGIDPSRPDLHLGHAVVLRKLRQFQDLGHTAILIIGDFTGRVGDPSGQSETRPFLTDEEIQANAQTYFDQAGHVLDMGRAEVHRNSEWLAPLTMADVLRLTASSTVARMLERDDFKVRYDEGRAVSIVEFLYPLMQAYDSVATTADVEMGGTDQTFNLLVGRDVQKAYGQEPQVVFTMPLLEGTDGVRKMSKSFDNYVGLTDPPDEMFGKLMRIPDGLIVKYAELGTLLDGEELAAFAQSLGDGSLKPNEAKRRVAREVVDLFHGPGAGEEAERGFVLVHRDHELPEEVPDVQIPSSSVSDGIVWLPRLLADIGLAVSNSEGKRLVEQGGVRVDGRPLEGSDLEWRLEDLVGRVIQVGRRRFARLRS